MYEEKFLFLKGVTYAKVYREYVRLSDGIFPQGVWSNTVVWMVLVLPEHCDPLSCLAENCVSLGRDAAAQSKLFQCSTLRSITWCCMRTAHFLYP